MDKQLKKDLSIDEQNVASLGESRPTDTPVRGVPVERGSLPCLNSNISTEISINSSSQPLLSKQILKSSNALNWNVFHFAEKHGLENIGFLTLTFKDHVLCPSEAQKRLNSLITHVIKPRYEDYIGVMERQKSGRIHYHLLVNVGFDIRTGVDFNMMIGGDYSSASKDLRKEWNFWRKTAPKYRFGRTELMPIKSTSEAIGKYVGKYIAKHMCVRDERDKNARLVRYSRGARVSTTRFQFLTEGSAEWRRKLSIFAHIVASRHGCEPTMENLSKCLGPRWAFNNRDFILSLP